RILIASTAAPSAEFLSPRPTHRDAARAADSVTRTSSRARLRSGFDPDRTSCEITPMRGRLPTHEKSRLPGTRWVGFPAVTPEIRPTAICGTAGGSEIRIQD